MIEEVAFFAFLSLIFIIASCLPDRDGGDNFVSIPVTGFNPLAPGGRGLG